jgi:hypothetical protein
MLQLPLDLMCPVYKPKRQQRFFPSGACAFDGTDDPQTVELASKAVVRRDVIDGWDIDPRVAARRAELAARGHRVRSFGNPALRCSRVPAGMVTTRGGIVLTSDRHWLVDSLGPASGAAAVIHPRRLIGIRVDDPVRSVDEDVAVVYSVLSDKKTANYYHWVVEGLTRVAMLREARVPETVRLLVPGPVSDMHRQSLTALGVDEARLLSWSGELTRFRTVYLPSGPQLRGSAPVAAAIDLLRRQTAPPRAAPGRRLWISRRLALRRRKRLLGEERLIAVAADLGFEEIHPETLTVMEQVEIFAQAEAIGGIHGAGLANAVFMQPGTRVAEAASDQLKARQKQIFWNLAAAGRQRYGYCVGIADGLDLRRFRRVLEEVLR